MHLGCTKIRLINAFHRSAKLLRCCFKHFSDHLVVKNLLIAIHRINHYDLIAQLVSPTLLLISDLSGG